MNNIQYFHDNSAGRTVAVDVTFTTAELLSKASGFSPKLNLSVGVSKVHPDDKYRKDTGRKVASSRLKEIQFSVGHVYYENNDIYFQLVHVDENEKMLTLGFKLKEGKDKPYFISAHYNYRNFF